MSPQTVLGDREGMQIAATMGITVGVLEEAKARTITSSDQTIPGYVSKRRLRHDTEKLHRIYCGTFTMAKQEVSSGAHQ